MIEKLTKNPNQIFDISDDSDAKMLLTELGLVDKFRKEIPGVPSSNQVATGECKTHYILALYFTGKTIKTDNGYLVYAMPKSQFSIREMGRFMDQVMTATSLAGCELVSSNLFSPTSN